MGKANGSSKKQKKEPDYEQMYKKLEESHDIYHKFFEEVNDAFFVSTKDGKLVDANKAYCELFGVNKEEIKKINVIETYVNPDDRREFLTRVERDGLVENYPVKLKNVNGREMDCRITAVTLLNKKEEIIGYQGIIYDVTEKKKLQKELENTKNDFQLYLNILIHDLRNFISVPNVYTSLGRKMVEDRLGVYEKLFKSGDLNRFYKVVKDDLKKTDEMLVNNQNVIKKAIGLIENIETLMKSQHTKKNFTKQNLNEILNSCIGWIKEKYDSNIPLSINYSGMPEANIMADELINNLFTNVFDNAIKYSDKKRTELWVKIEDSVEYWGVRIADTGSGIPEGQRGRVFERYERLKHHEVSGKGLGGVLIKSLAERYDGEVTIEDRIPGDYTQGTCFIIKLPKYTVD